LREPAASSSRVEYAGSSFLQNVGKYVAEHMAWHHITSQEKVLFKNKLPYKTPTLSLLAVNNC
jgi:hypothetical protein